MKKKVQICWTLEAHVAELRKVSKTSLVFVVKRNCCMSGE